ncbi:AAA family ATPase, partial [bacterium 1XD42-8]
MEVTKEVGEILNKAIGYAFSMRQEYVTPEHLLAMITLDYPFRKAFENCGGNADRLVAELQKYIKENVEEIAGDEAPILSNGLEEVLEEARKQAYQSEKGVVGLSHVIHAIFTLRESNAAYFMELQGVDEASLLHEFLQITSEKGSIREQEERKEGHGQWKAYVQCLHDRLEEENPFIGRKKELERTVQILCRKEKNNPLHVGEAGVGKTAIAYGLARLLEEGKVPAVLLGAKIYALDLGGMLSGTQYRGDFEKRFKEVMEGIAKEEKPIVYMDEIHNIVGAGAVNGGSFDVSNMLKPYLSAGHIRFLGATTYQEYKKYFEKNKSLVRRFQNIDVKEPSIEETVEILEGLKKHYERFHGVKYGKDVLQYMVLLSVKYMNERYLPDKAIDLMDEAGAYRQIHPLNQKIQTVNKELVDEIVAKICHIPKQAVEKDETKKLSMLKENLSKEIFGQEEGILQVVNAVKFSRAGLMDEEKPVASLLFVGPTGVGKTEVAKTLAKELGISFIRFDMSEYGEKHAMAKLIGAPAGYVGYEEGGLLTEEIRKHPHGVLLLDEVEKAHPDIFNILLQVMDYATLTDNQGRKADFRNIILIMTSNAGAFRLGKEKMGFG